MRPRRMLFTAFLATSFVIAAGCRYDWTYAEDESEGGTSPDGGGGVEGSTVDSQGTEASPPPDVVEPPPQCSTVQKCSALNQYCEFSDQKCGKTQPEGKCQNYGLQPCESQMACSCTGVAMDKCLSFKNGSDIDLSWNTCGGYPDTFKCGTTPVTFCKRGLQFCQVKASGVPIGCKDIKACAMGCSCPEVKNATASCTSCNDGLEPGAVQVNCP